MSWKILQGDALAVLRTLPPDSVQMVVTSPPYWGLRDYGVPGQLGQEPTPEEYVAKMVEVFAEVRRVLRPSGVLWLNLGDTYASTGGHSDAACRDRRGQYNIGNRPEHDRRDFRARPDAGIKPKDLVGIPWQVAFALRADGWWLRSEVIWEKKNPMPESVTDRPTKAHEQIFLLSKSQDYFYDAEAIKEPALYGDHRRHGTPDGTVQAPGQPPQAGLSRRRTQGDPVVDRYMRELGMSEADAGEYLQQLDAEDPELARKERGHKREHQGFRDWDRLARKEQCTGLRNKRSVWSVATEAFPDAHFATFPTELIKPCILAGTSEAGECPTCGTPWERLVERTAMEIRRTQRAADMGEHGRTQSSGTVLEPNRSATVGWGRACKCAHAAPVAQTVLDPFSGSGTSGVVALRHGRRYLGIELNPAYVQMARRRIDGDSPMFNRFAEGT